MISPDLPITQKTDDTLNRSSFAQTLAHVMLQYSSSASFTIGLYGEWGSGKTSLLNMVLETIESIDDGVIVLRFNPWLCSDPKQLITQFFKQLATAVKMKKTTSDHAWELIDQYADIFDAANIIPVVGSLVAATGKVLTTEAKKRVNMQAKDLQESKNQIVRKIQEDNLKMWLSL